MNKTSKKVQKIVFKKDLMEKLTKNYGEPKIFENNPIVQECKKKVYVSKKKLIRGNKKPLINEGISKNS